MSNLINYPEPLYEPSPNAILAAIKLKSVVEFQSSMREFLEALEELRTTYIAEAVRI